VTEPSGTDGRVEIQRLIGRSLRAAVDLTAMPEVTLTIDCDVLQADGGTRTAAISGAWLALHDALTALSADPKGQIPEGWLLGRIAAVSVGIVGGGSGLRSGLPGGSRRGSGYERRYPRWFICRDSGNRRKRSVRQRSIGISLEHRRIRLENHRGGTRCRIRTIKLVQPGVLER
jgi:hypothetical protein